MKKFTISDIEKALNYLKKNYSAAYVVIDFDERDRMLMKATDMSGNAVVITIFDESTAKFPELSRTERL
jgi:hypothetical protein